MPLKDPIKRKEYERLRHQRLREKYLERTRNWHKTHPNANRDWKKAHPERTRATQKRSNLKRKMEEKLKIFELLGNRCANPFGLPHPDWCNDPRCLQIDHINGGGTKEINLHGHNRSYYKMVRLKIENGSKDYQLLCSNCNWLKRYENGENGGNRNNKKD